MKRNRELLTTTDATRGSVSLTAGRLCFALVTTLGVMTTGYEVFGGEKSLEYNRDIRPILADNCFACHGPDSAARKADLRLDKREAAIEFGALVPHESSESELFLRLTSDDPDLLMPPAETKKKLSAEQIAKLRRWIDAGAEYQPHWSFIQPVQSSPPATSNRTWAKHEIDRFVLWKLEQNGLAPAAEADTRTFFRRLHLDITGLPPSPQDAARFSKEYEKRKDKAVSDWVDKLMQSSAWGEHRARYWLDAARYGDTHGLHFDNYREMWPYRDWVIRAFNANQPFDEFTVEQIAGDLLPSPTDDQLIATGFQRCNITTNEGGTIDEENLAIYAADRVQTFGWVYLGLTTNCGQCHDHKFDPFTMKDYYSLAAFFRNTTQQAKDGNVKDGRGPVLVVPSGEDRGRWQSLPEEITAAKAKQENRRAAAQGEFDRWLAAADVDSLDGMLPTDDLLVHVPLTEGSGNTVRSAGDDPSAFAATGDVTWIQEGKLGPAPVMKPGSTFDLGNLGNFGRDQGFSFGAWIRVENGGASGAIIARMDEGQDYRGWDLWQQGQSLAVHVIDVWPTNALKVTTRQKVLQPGRWQHVFATYDGSGKPQGVKIYVDGKPQPHRAERKTLKADASIQASTSLRIGQRSRSQGFRGAVQDVRLFGRQLEPNQVQAIAQLAPLRSMLATPPEEQSSEQREALYEHYLTTEDAEYSQLVKQIAELEAERESIRERSPVTHIQQERKNSAAMASILMRGQYDRPGEEVSARTPAALHPMAEGAPNNRLGLAQWLVDPANPLTARVAVNRFWQQIFGRGIVTTPEDFGVMGAPPSHPELLDWLAVDFQQNGWNVKRFFKQILTSATYRQAAIVTEEKLERDRDNALLSRGPRFRMDAEMVRDYALSVSGLLAKKMYGPSVRPYQPEAIWDIVGLPGGNTRNYVEDKGVDLYRRTVYTFWKRMAPPPNLEAFNAPSREVCTVRRERTNTPLQALVTLNDPQFVEAARCLAQRAMKETAAKHPEASGARVLNYIARQVLGRRMSKPERSVLLADHDEYLAYYQANLSDANALIAVGASQADASIGAARLAAWTMVCNQVMNLDEALNK